MVEHWVGSDRRARLPDDWQKRRAAVRRRAQGKCEWQRVTALLPWLPQGEPPCPAYGSDCDHVERGDLHSLENLAWLCGTHHRAKSSAEGNSARATRRKREPERHPGLR